MGSIFLILKRSPYSNLGKWWTVSRKYLVFWSPFLRSIVGWMCLLKYLKKLFKFKLDDRNPIIMVNIDICNVSGLLSVKQYILPFKLSKLRNKFYQSSTMSILNMFKYRIFVLWLKENFWTRCRNHVNPVICRKFMCVHKSSHLQSVSFLFSVVFFIVVSFSNCNFSSSKCNERKWVYSDLHVEIRWS